MQQTIHPITLPFRTRVTIPGSKTISQRALLIAALADGVSEISGIRICQSTRILLRALHQLGIVTQLDEKARTCIIAGGNGKLPKKQATLWCASTKSLTQFLLAACSATPGTYCFDGTEQLRKKSLSQILEILNRQGIQITPTNSHQLPLTLIGADTIEGGEIRLDKTNASDIISALLVIAPHARSPLTFHIPDGLDMQDIDITCSVMANFGVLVHRIHQAQFMVPVPQRYLAKDITIEPDFSLAAYFFVAAAITNSEITIQATKYSSSKQVDASFLSVLQKIGCCIDETDSGLTLKGINELHGFEVGLRHFSDTFMALVAMAPFSKSPIRIFHQGTLSKQESKRLANVQTELSKIGVHVEAGDKWIKIFPSKPTAGKINSHHDPRIVMGFSIIGLKVPGIVIDDAECINKLFPDFFAQWGKLTEHKNVNA